MRARRREGQATARSRAAAGVRGPRLWCAVGLLLTVAHVACFGFDLTDDSVGFALVAVGALRLSRRRLGGSAMWLVAGLAAVAAAVLAGLSYGGAVGRFFLYPDHWWTAVALGAAVATAVVVVGILLALHGEASVHPAVSRLLPVVAAAAGLGAIGQVVLVAAGLGYTGAAGYVVQVAALLLGAAQVATTAVLFVPVEDEK